MPKEKKDAGIILLGCLAGTGVAVLLDPDRLLVATVAVCALLGLIANMVGVRNRGRITPVRALMIVAILSPLPLLPVLWLIFHQRMVWPVIGSWSSWGLGLSLLPLPTRREKT